MTQSSWITRSYEAGDENGYLRLMNTVFPNYKCDLKRWRWEFKENPFDSLQVFSDSDGKIVGTMGLTGVPVKVGKIVVQGSQAVDLAIQPESRGKGMFVEIGKRLMQEAENKKFILSYGVPNEPAYHGHLKYGWFTVSEVPVLTKVISKKALLLIALARTRDVFRERRLTSIPNITALTRYLIRSARTLADRQRPLRAGIYTKRDISLFDERFDRLWAEASVKYELLVVRNKKYLNWRYIERPYSNYRVLTIERSNEIEGYVVLFSEIRNFSGWKKGYIIDIFARSEEGARFLIQLACNCFAEENIDVAICWMMKNQLYYNCFIERGFVNDTLSSPKLICRINTSDGAFKGLYHSVEKNWFFTMGDSDWL